MYIFRQCVFETYIASMSTPASIFQDEEGILIPPVLASHSYSQANQHPDERKADLFRLKVMFAGENDGKHLKDQIQYTENESTP